MTKESKRIVFQVLLFVATFITTTMAGAEWAYGKSVWAPVPYTWADFSSGFSFSIPLILFLTVHEFGHYFMALYHKVKTSLPYYIPIPPIPFSIGTMGAVIRLRSKPYSNVQTFDIGLAGPLAGFVVSICILIYGFATLPPGEYVFQFHPEYAQYGLDYADHVYNPAYYDKIIVEQKANGQPGQIYDITLGKNLLFLFLEQFVSDPSRIPNAHELMHYPVLLAGFLSLFVTSLNLLPIGQLDGGHVVYGLFGFKKHSAIATVFFIALVLYAGVGLSYINPALPREDLVLGLAGYFAFLFFIFSGLRKPVRDTVMYALLVLAFHFALHYVLPGVHGYTGWLIMALIISRFIGIQHPPSEIEVPLDPKRVILGWVTLVVFALCFSPLPLELTTYPANAQ